MNRRFRLALLLAALAAAGPSTASPQAFETARASVTIAWFRVATPSHSQVEVKPAGLEQAGLKARLYGARPTFSPQPGPLLPDSLLLHPLFQRPPPLHS